MLKEKQKKGKYMRNINLKNTYIQLPDKFYVKQLPDIVPDPKLVILNENLADFLEMESEFLKDTEGVEMLTGNQVPKGSYPISQAYAGHQFGHFTMLGDGRAVLLGERMGLDGQSYDIQLKGSGKTSFSRGGDGKAVLGPMLREYIISEGMYGLKIPTTRSLSVCKTGESIIREGVFPGAVLVRVARSHIRVGTFEYAAAFLGENEVKMLADYTICRHYPEVMASAHPYLEFLKAVVKNQAETVAKWQLVGFIHGVMNTDNMTVSGETIDYGPCAFMDDYNPETVFSSIDREGRYAYGKQPGIAMWNLSCFAETLLPLLAKEEKEAVKLAQEAVEGFREEYGRVWLQGMRGKLGLFQQSEEDRGLIERLLSLMRLYQADYTNTFLELTLETEEGSFFQNKEVKAWKDLWKRRVKQQNYSKEEIREKMQENNPVVIPRNHLVEEVLEHAWKNDEIEPLKELVKAVQRPFDYCNIPSKYTKIPEKNKCYKTFCGT